VGRRAFGRDAAERNFAASLGRLREHGFGRRWIVAKEHGASLGFTDTKYFGESCDEVSPDDVEIGWMITPSAWGQGYATEAGSAVRDEAFDRLELESIVAVHHPENAASGRIMEKLGMAFEGDVVARNGWPYRLYRLTREQWRRGDPTIGIEVVNRLRADANAGSVSDVKRSISTEGSREENA
jgi:RimJ/RimL family protein N-acetyltransferase